MPQLMITKCMSTTLKELIPGANGKSIKPMKKAPSNQKMLPQQWCRRSCPHLRFCGNENLLQSVLEGLSQNNNEVLNHLVWDISPKESNCWPYKRHHRKKSRQDVRAVSWQRNSTEHQDMDESKHHQEAKQKSLTAQDSVDPQTFPIFQHPDCNEWLDWKAKIWKLFWTKQTELVNSLAWVLISF